MQKNISVTRIKASEVVHCSLLLVNSSFVLSYNPFHFMSSINFSPENGFFIPAPNLAVMSVSSVMFWDVVNWRAFPSCLSFSYILGLNLFWNFIFFSYYSSKFSIQSSSFLASSVLINFIFTYFLSVFVWLDLFSSKIDQMQTYLLRRLGIASE